MKKTFRAVGAAGLAAATIVTGLSFGPAAAHAGTPQQPSEAGASNSTSATQVAMIVLQDTSKAFNGLGEPTSGERLLANPQATREAAEQFAETWQLPVEGHEGAVSRNGLCLTNSGKLVAILPRPCNGSRSQLIKWATTSNDYVKGPALSFVETPGYFVSFTGARNYLWNENAAGGDVVHLKTFAAEVTQTDVNAGTATISGPVPSDVTSVRVKWTDEAGLAKQKTASVTDGKYSAYLSGLKLGTTTVELEAREGSVVVASTTVDVKLEVAPVTATATFGDDVHTVVQVSGTAQPNARVTVRHGENDLVTVKADAEGKWSTPITAPNMPGNYELTVGQEIRGQDNGRVSLDIDYGAGVVVTSPDDDFVLEPGEALDLEGTAPAGTEVKVYEKGTDGVLASTTAAKNNTWFASVDGLEDREYTLVAEGITKGYNRTRAELTVNPGKSTAKPLVIESPADGSTITSPTKQITFTGTGEPGAKVRIATGTPGRTVVDTTVNSSGTWTGTGELAYGVDYALVTTYTVPGQAPVSGTHHVHVDPTSVSKPFEVASPAEGSTVVAADKKVPFAIKGTTGTEVKIWNWSGKDRVIASGTIGATGDLTLTGELNNQNTRYDLFVEYTEPGKTTQSLTRSITVASSDMVTQPFEVSSPAEGSTVVAADKKVPFAITGTTGTEVKIWNWSGKDRVIASGTIGATGSLTLTGELNNQNTRYDLFVEYTEPGKTTQSLTRTITVAAAAATKPFAFTNPAEGAVVPLTANGTIAVSGEGAPGGTVTIWNWHTKDRVVTGTPLTVGPDGSWSGTAYLGAQGYALHVEYTAPGSTTPEVLTRNITTTN
ncbi:hypothetical protein [Curtobacterium caseinilyticum]|uniref:Bacterial Ig domain-containing protein n=1 Tax=Curtobacterium caseinilyticum TaxID=3055137 RepID=A0ABT7TR19_9MICO|nr:hypothetical protein [Curtobacterium caseinilyticum]MDM7892030.1 hypothetical protein [Curtobacterium caseinilyticum]